MKRIIILFAVAWSATVMLRAQSPEKINYQAVIRNNSGALLITTQVGMQISILQDSASGTAVYSEIQTPSTNINGLVSIEIGTGTPVQGDFATIDWANGPFYIQTEIDPTGGTTYTISNTSQVLSVPYALYAKTAGSTDGTSCHHVGEFYGGGVIFWVDHTGQHGLIINLSYISLPMVWSNVSDSLVGTTNDWDGTSNTTAIISQNRHIESAAKLCSRYSNPDNGDGRFSDWYLPSIAELILLWSHFYEVQKALIDDDLNVTSPLAKFPHWSSTENGSDHDGSSAWTFDFKTGDPYCDEKKTGRNYFRAVRAF